MSGANLRVAATQAQLNPDEKKQVDALSKLVDTHKSLLDLPAKQAQQKYSQLPQQQKDALVEFNGTEPEKKRGFWGSAWHYTGGYALDRITEASDFMTRLYRFSRIEDAQPGNQYKGLSGLKEAWDATGDNGEMFFDEGRLTKARAKFGQDRISVAIKAGNGMPLDEIIAKGTEAEKQIASKAAKRQDPLFQDAYDAVAAAKFSPGRDVANALLPEQLEGTGFLYKGISGTVDAFYRFRTDPLLLLGKAKKAYDAANYALMKIVKNPEKVDEAFTNPNIVNFFDTYGKELDALKTARASKDIKAATDAATRLKRIAPEFGPAAIDEFIKAGVKDAPTAKNYLANTVDVKKILAGQPARQTPLIPRLDAARKARIAFYTGASKVIDIDKSGRKIITALYGLEPEYADIATGLINDPSRIAGYEAFVSKLKGPTGAMRMPLDVIQGRIDRFSAKFTAIPYFKDGFFDVMADNASDQVYRVARLANSRYHSKMIAEAFEAGSEGQRKQIFTGLWNTVAEIRGVSKAAAGKSYMDQFAGKGLEKKYAADIVVDGVNKGNPAQFGDQQLALFPYQLSSAIAVPKIVDLDRIAVRAGIINKMLGISQQRWADTLIGGWVLGTLAGPRFVLRNATEDLMAHLAIGDSPWGMAQGRALSTRIRLSKGLTAEDSLKEVGKKALKLDLEAGEVGVINKLVRRKELKKYATQIKAAQTPEDVRKIMADAILNDGVGKYMDKKGAEYIAEIAQFGNLDDTLRAIAEGSKNALQGADQYIQATNDVNRYGKMAAIEIDGVAYRQALGESAFTEFNPVANQQNRISWLVQLGVSSTDDLAQIAVKNLDNEEKALAAMREYLGNLTEAQRNRFQLYDPSVGGNIAVHAKKAYDATRNLYSKRNGEINMDLLAKVRTLGDDGEYVVSTKNLSLEDLPDKMDTALTPEFISGPTLVPVSDTGNFAASLSQRAWDGMGEANARFSREPIVINEMVRIRKEMAESGLEKRIIDSYTRGIPKTEEDLIKSLNPNISRTEGVSLVKTDFVKKFLEYDRTLPTENFPSSAKTIANITEDLKEGKGFTNPLILAYDIDKDGNLLLKLIEGNHRVQAALKAGIDDIPVRIVSNSGGISKFKLAGEKSKIQPDERNYIPGSPNPSEVLPDSAFGKKLDPKKMEEATTNAKKEIVALAEELAKNRVLAFVDNPAVRSQLAMASRNFARFYRATEDFYRRVYRTVRYNPEAISRLALTYEGVTHSGFVQQDDNGDSYFFYPGLTPVYETMNNVAQFLGSPEAFKAPMPVEFGGKLNMLTPSMNPDSLFPTFAGPLAAVPMKFVFNAVPALDKFEKVILGVYAEDQPMINAIFPAHVSRFLATLNRDERQSQYASAFRKAATYLEATGHGVKPKYNTETGEWEPPSPAEVQEYKDKIGASTVSVLALRFIFGFFAPAAPQTTLKSEMADWARANERVNFKQVFNNLITQYNGSLDKAMTEWVRLFPDEMPYTVSESSDDVVPVVRAVEATTKWLDKNSALLKAYPQGAPFLMPKVGDFDFDAYRLLFKSGIKFSKTIDDFLQDTQAARDIQFYYDQKDQYEEELARTFNDTQKTQLREQWGLWAKQFKGSRPALQDELAEGGDRQRARQRSYEDLQNMLNGPQAAEARRADKKAFDAIKKMSDIYNNYLYSRDLVVGSSASALSYKDLLKQNTKTELEKIASENPNAEDAYYVLFSRLIGD